MRLNEQQLAAVNEPPKNITVSAAAGSGKTQVLGARVLRRVSGDEPADVNRLLIVTFTRAAAAEMRSRISRSISDALKTEAEPARRKNLERQLSLLGGADVCTIDSFCYRILKQNFFRVPGLAPDFTVGSEASVRDISSEALRAAVEMFSSALEESRGGKLNAHYGAMAEELRSFFPEGETAALLEGFALLSENYGSAKRANDFVTEDKSRRGEDYIEFVRRIKRTLASAADPEDWLRQRAADYDPAISFDETKLGRYAAARAASLLGDMAARLENELNSGGLNPNNAAVFGKTLDNLRALGRPETYSRAAEIFAAPFPVGGRLQLKDIKAAPGNPSASKAMESIKGIWNKTAELFAAPTDKIDFFRAKLRPAVLALLGLTWLTVRLEREKMLEKKRLSFSACVGLALELLTGDSETAAALRDYYEEIYVDEAQDIDPRQLAIFQVISKGNLFMVGDVKQSIYGFRQAEPEIFNSRCRDGENSRLITMNVNYRSSAAVIGAVNQVFGRLMNESTMAVDYEREHRMERGESWLPKPARAEFLAVVDNEKFHGTYKAREEAQALVNRIIELVDSKRLIYDKDTGEQRPIEYRDFMVLFRANRDGAELERVFTENGVSCYLDGGAGLYSREEITAVADVLRLVDNPLQDIPLAAALRGLMFGFGENELLRIRTVSANRAFSEIFAALSDPKHPRHGEYAARLDCPELLERCVKAGGLFERWRYIAAFRPVTELIEAIIGDTGYYSSVGALPSGAARRANLELLLDMAAEFEAAGSRGLYSFICYMDRQELAGGGEQTEAKTLSAAVNVVRLMTVHKSKGLEAPAVVLFRCPAPFSDKSSALALSRELGFSADYINEDRGYRYKSPLSPLIGLELRSRERAEEIRLLYVAMTRPREILICTGYYPNQAALDRALAFDSPLTLGDAVFNANSYAKLLGASVTDERFWRLDTVAAADIAGPRPSRLLPSAEAFGENVLETAGRLMGFSYEYAASAALPAKISVSALKAGFFDEDAPPAAFDGQPRRALKAPAFAGGEEKISGAALGTAYHAAMETLDFNAPVPPQLDRLEKTGIISPALRKLIRDERITALLESPLGRRLRAAKRLWREAPFMIAVPAREIVGPDAPENETVAVQGIIDCFFEDAEGVVIVDYKTDSYSDPEELTEKYKKQLLYYEKAIRKKFSDKKIQKYLYLFHKGDIIEI